MFKVDPGIATKIFIGIGLAAGLFVIPVALGRLTSSDEPQPPENSVSTIEPANPAQEAGTQQANSPQQTTPPSTVAETIGELKTNLDLTETDRSSQTAVAEAFGCAYWARPIRGETLTELSQRLKPLTNDALANAITQLRSPTDNSVDTISVTAGAVEKIEENRYRIFCNQTVFKADGLPNGPPQTVDSVVRVENSEEGWLVTELQLGALKIP